MEMNGIHVIFILSWLISIIFLKTIIFSKMNLIYKFIYSAILVIPVLGPIFYLMIASDLEPQRAGLQNRSSPFNNLWGWGRYTDEWGEKKKELQKKLDELKRESFDDSDDNNDDLTNQNK